MTVKRFYWVERQQITRHVGKTKHVFYSCLPEKVDKLQGSIDMKEK